MIGVDTNVLVRYLAQDEPLQAKAASAFLERLRPDDPALVCDIVLVELVWVLESAYGYARQQIVAVLYRMTAVPALRFQEFGRVRAAIDAYRDQGVDLADALIAATCVDMGADRTVSFDRKAARLAAVDLL